MKRQAIMSIFMAMVLFLSASIGIYQTSAYAEIAMLTDQQRNAIAMLNYITVLTQDIIASKNSRLFMEEAYSSLINNTYPNAVDSRTLSQLTGLLDTMENYRMIAVKRDRLKYIYEQNQAQAIRAAVPNPIGMISAVQSFRPSKIAASIVYMAVDSITSYASHTAEADLQYLKDGWALGDEETTVLHNSRKGTFSYMVRIVGDYNLPGDLTLTESAVEEFVRWKNDENVLGRIQFLESNQNTYQSYGGYWLLLADSYFNNGNYDKCLEAIRAYEALNTRIFRKDYELAKILPLVISAADEVYKGEAYVSLASNYAQMILDNTDHDDWALRYFAAQAYLDLYGKKQEKIYLESAYDIVLDNVNYLAGEQRAMNTAYLAPVKESPTLKDATKDEKDQINKYNKMLKEIRKTETPPVYEPLQLNCDLLFALAAELGISESEQQKIDGILHPKGKPIFLTEPLESKYWFMHDSNGISTDTDIEYGGTVMILPAAYLTANAVITVTVKEADSNEAVIMSDWRIDKIERRTEGDNSTYQVAYTSDSARKHTWAPNAQITIDIVPMEGADLPTYHFEYITAGTKKEWYDYLKVWEGHINSWYDYAKVWENKVTFDRVK